MQSILVALRLQKATTEMRMVQDWTGLNAHAVADLKKETTSPPPFVRSKFSPKVVVGKASDKTSAK